MTKQLEGQLSFADLGLPFGKTSPTPSAVTKDETSKTCSKPSRKSVTPTFQYLFLKKVNGKRPDASWEAAGALHGECTTLNFGEFPSVARESTLSQILVPNAPAKYYLSQKACEGILRRADRRGKELPPMLKDALMEVVRLAS